MDFHDFSLTHEEIALITPENVGNSPAAIVLLKMAKTVHDRQTGRLFLGEVGVSNEDPRKDFRFALGEGSLAKTLLDAPVEAKKWCSQ